MREPEHLPLRRQLIDPEAIGLVRPLNGYAMAASKFSRLPTVVDMAVREHHLDQLATGLGNRCIDTIEITTRAAAAKRKDPLPAVFADQPATEAMKTDDKKKPATRKDAE